MSTRPGSVTRRIKRPLRRVRDAVLRGGARIGHACGAPRYRQIVICGYPRSGTSLLYNMLSASLEGFAFGRFEVPCLEHIRDRSHFVSKRPLDVFELERLAERNVRGKALFAIVVIRDLRDVITSIHPRLPHDYFIGYDASYAIGTDVPGGAKRTHPGIKAYYDQIERIQGIRGLHVVSVRYEDLIAHPDAIQGQLAEALGVSFTRRFGEFHEHPERHAYRYAGSERALDSSLVRENDPIDLSRRGKWREPAHKPRIQSQFRAHPDLFEMLRAHGYERDDAWFESFDTSDPREPAGARRGAEATRA